MIQMTSVYRPETPPGRQLHNLFSTSDLRIQEPHFDVHNSLFVVVNEITERNLSNGDNLHNGDFPRRQGSAELSLHHVQIKPQVQFH